MLVDALFTILFGVLNILTTPLYPLFAWVPDPASVMSGVPDLLNAAFRSGSAFLYYLNLGPVMTFALVVVGGMVGVRIAFIAFDLILPPIPFLGKLYMSLMSIIRGV